MRKLPPQPRNKKPKKVDLLVIRANRTNLGNSKPCVHCILKLKDLHTRGYVLNKVFFSTSNGAIVSCRLEDLEHDALPHMSAYYRGTGFSVR